MNMNAFLPFLLFLLPLSLFSKTLTLQEAMQEGWIGVEATGEGGYEGRCLKLKIQNHQKKKWKLIVPAGFIFHSRDSFIQDLMVIRSREVEMKKKEDCSLRLYANCIQASNSSPGRGRAFLPGEAAEGKLAELAGWLDEHRVVESSAQYAIWAVTDGKSIANIDHPELMAFTAQLLGKDLPVYTIVQGQRRPVEGQPAFMDKPSIIKGEFNYSTDRDIKASFGLYHASGERMHSLFEGKDQRKGHHRFKFYFEVDKLSPGTYFARLTDENGNTVDELKIDF
jgi:hypothetical protein